MQLVFYQLVAVILFMNREGDGSPIRSRRLGRQRDAVIGRVVCHRDAMSYERQCTQIKSKRPAQGAWFEARRSVKPSEFCVTKMSVSKELIYNETLDANIDGIFFPRNDLFRLTKKNPKLMCTWTARVAAEKPYFVSISKMDIKHYNANASLCLRVDGKKKGCRRTAGTTDRLRLPIQAVTESNQLNVSIVLTLSNARNDAWALAKAEGSYSADSPKDLCRRPVVGNLKKGKYYYEATKKDCGLFRGKHERKYRGVPFDTKENCRNTCGVNVRPSVKILLGTQRLPTQRSFTSSRNSSGSSERH